MNFVLNMLLRVLLVFLLVPLNKLKGKVFIHVYIDGNRIVFRDGIYPSWNCSFDIYEGAHNNLPDSAAMTTAQRIQTMFNNAYKKGLSSDVDEEQAMLSIHNQTGFDIIISNIIGVEVNSISLDFQ